jgi:hypothetical protein
MAAKAEQEHGPVPPGRPARTAADLESLHRRLDEAELASPLPERPSAQPRFTTCSSGSG